MKTIGALILEKLTAIETRMGNLEVEVKKLQQDSFLYEEYVPKEKTKTSSHTDKPIVVANPVQEVLDFNNSKSNGEKRKYHMTGARSPHTHRAVSATPSNLSSDIQSSTEKFYENIYLKICEYEDAFRKLIKMRNEGELSADILKAVSDEYPAINETFIRNAPTVGVRYGIIERKGGKYIFCDGQGETK